MIREETTKTRPSMWSIIITEGLWIVVKIVQPSSAQPLMSLRMSLPMAESSPVVGSSRHSSPGRVNWTRLIPMETRLASPPEMPLTSLEFPTLDFLIF